jgi:hypothetical protein
VNTPDESDDPPLLNVRLKKKKVMLVKREPLMQEKVPPFLHHNWSFADDADAIKKQPSIHLTRIALNDFFLTACSALSLKWLNAEICSTALSNRVKMPTGASYMSLYGLAGGAWCPTMASLASSLTCQSPGLDKSDDLLYIGERPLVSRVRSFHAASR